MTTSRDLLIVAMDRGAERPVEEGDLSLALAGAEMADLLGAEAVRLEGDRIVPADRPAPADPLLAAAFAELVRGAPHESLADWLWRRGRGLAAVYGATLETEGQLVRERRRFRVGSPAPADTPDRRRAVDRWNSGDPVLAALAEAAGIPGERTGDAPDVADDAVAAVLAATNDAVLELGSVRQRRAIDEAAFDNIWRGGV
ncbi:GPP34 family phosphoprotein [Streptomyces sp. NPDC058662]|uniref:GPP34 family phosphoprotein n=1 Tax=Streptomyces sp. NPDC058662 TaxID=3346583 RepID=UPI003646FAC4